MNDGDDLFMDDFLDPEFEDVDENGDDIIPEEDDIPVSYPARGVVPKNTKSFVLKAKCSGYKVGECKDVGGWYSEKYHMLSSMNNGIVQLLGIPTEVVQLMPTIQVIDCLFSLLSSSSSLSPSSVHLVHKNSLSSLPRSFSSLNGLKVLLCLDSAAAHFFQPRHISAPQ